MIAVLTLGVDPDIATGVTVKTLVPTFVQARVKQTNVLKVNEDYALYMLLNPVKKKFWLPEQAGDGVTDCTNITQCAITVRALFDEHAVLVLEWIEIPAKLNKPCGN